MGASVADDGAAVSDVGAAIADERSAVADDGSPVADVGPAGDDERTAVSDNFGRVVDDHDAEDEFCDSAIVGAVYASPRVYDDNFIAIADLACTCFVFSGRVSTRYDSITRWDGSCAFVTGNGGSVVYAPVPR